MKKLKSLLLGFGLVFAISTSVSANAELETDEKEAKINAVPVASISGPTTVNAGDSHTYTVSTSSSAGPHTFYFNPGDGSGTQRFDSSNASRGFPHAYRGYNYSQSITQQARVADQRNISSWRTRSITVRAF